MQIFVQNICELLEYPYTKLRYVDLSNMGLKKEHLRLILRSLKKNSVLQSLNLGHLESLDDVQMVRDMLNIEEQRALAVASPSNFSSELLLATKNESATFHSAFINSNLRSKFKQDSLMAQSTLFSEAAHLTMTTEQPVVLNRSSQHRELIFNRYSPFGAFDARLCRKWFMVRDCFYSKRHRYTLVYFNQRSPGNNDFRLLEGQEQLMQKIEESAALAEQEAKQREGDCRSRSGIERLDPMIIAGGHLYRMVDPIVFAGHLCMQDVMAVKRDQLDRAKQPQGALDVTQCDVDRAKLGQREL